ncbi:RNA polymerase sigma factor, FliA/WhiG family/RNA polymerase sigma factor, sigma-70 family [SAR116 cluster alpha proteobacterium HIMB100]|nr:RNA polymerase sigma factor, FliA/WhiG family/RNA polymerase sigma factor, sigma-70 family [SAR116 cluster alpha proteobacterium HIMB100]
MKHSYAEQQPDVEELIASHSELVRKIAWQIHGRARHITEIEDIMQIGYTGLIVAAQNYTPLDGASFASYASIRIRGAIVDYLRKSSNLCRTTIQIKKKYNQAVEKLERRLLRQPNRLEIADELDMSEDQLIEWEAAFQANTPQSIDSVYDQFSIWFTSPDNNPEEEVNEVELQELLKEALRHLPEREALVIQLYYVEELNVFEIAEVLEVSTGRVSQIKKSAVGQLRQFIEKANQVD